MPSDLKQKADDWKARILKLIIFYVVLGMIVLAVAVTLVSNMMKQIIPQ